MKKLFTLAILMLMIVTSIFAQQVTTVTFTGERQDKSYQKLDSVLVTNLSQNWSEVVYYPDTLILLSNVGITDYESRNGKVHLYQNIPNPFHGVTNFNLSLANKEKVDLVIYDISGRKVAEYHNTLPSGEHQFRAAMDIPQTYLLSALSKSGTTSIKMINLSNTGEQAHIELISSLPFAGDAVKYESQHGFKPGDEMKYVGYATQNDGLKDATVTKVQNESGTITFVFPNEIIAKEVAVTTGNASGIEYNTATLAGTYVAKGTEIKETGFEYKISKDEKFDKFVSKDITSPFTVTIKTLDAGTEYTYKAYVKTTEDSIVYGEEKTFTTEKITETVIKTEEPTDIEQRSATFHGSYVLGSEPLMGVGFEVKKADGKDFETVDYQKEATTPFEYTYTDKLEPRTKYIYRAYAVTQSGVYIFGNEVTFTTAEPTPELAVVKTEEYNTDYYNGSKALLYGLVLSDGYCALKEVGFYLGKTEKPQDDGTKYACPGLDPYFKIETDVLEPSTTYYFVAYATNEVGTAYGEVLKFESRKAGAAPELAIANIVPFATSAQVSCSVKHPALGIGETEEAIIEKGVCYSEKENPTIADAKVAADNDKTEDFVVTMNKLKANTTYYVRAYAQVLGNTVYSEQQKFTTVAMTKPEVQTVSIDKAGTTSAIITSKLIVTGGSENITLGVRVFNEELKFDSIYVSKEALSTDNTFKSYIYSLEKETKYNAQAYARNEEGEAFGEVLTFTTDTGFACGSILVDVDGNSYGTVQIGSNCWMADNLRVKHYADGRELSSEWKYGNIKDRYFKEIENEYLPNGSNVFYPWSTATDNSEGNKDHNKHIQGICPDGWHIPSYLEFSDMINAVDNNSTISLDKWIKGAGKGFAGNSITSPNMLAIKLSAKEGLWKDFWDAGPVDNGIDLSKGLSSKVAESPGYAKDNDLDVPWNESGFNGWPCGYIDKKDQGWYMDGNAAYMTNYSTTAQMGTYSFKFNYNNTGASIYSWTDNEGWSGYSVRCVQDTGIYEEPDPVVEECKATLILEETDGWTESEFSIIITHKDGTEDFMAQDISFEMPTHKEFDLSFQKVTFKVNCLSFSSFDPERMRFTLKVDGIGEFISEKIFEKFRGAKSANFEYTCGEKEPSVF